MHDEALRVVRVSMGWRWTLKLEIGSVPRHPMSG